MKIVYLVHDYVDSGGIERVISIKSNYLVNNGYEVYIISCCGTEKQAFFHFDSKIKFHNLEIPSLKEKYKALFVEKLSVYLKEIQADIVISTGMRVMNYLYEVNDGSKKILELHFSKYRRKYKLAKLEGSIFGRFLLNLYYCKMNKIVRRYDRFVVLTEEDKQSWLVSSIPNIEVIPNPLTFVPTETANLKEKRIIAIGRFTYQKGFEYLLKIWSEIQSCYPDWILAIYGDGRKKAELGNLISKLQLSNRVEFYPPASNIAKELENSSIFVQTSRYEGLPMVLLEAMVSGVPPICFACKCGPKDVICDGEDGILVKQGDLKEFANKLSLLIENYELRIKMGSNARKNIMRFRQEDVMQKWVTLFNELKNGI